MSQLKIGISAFLPVYNEESRISHTLQSLVWCDEVILIDKESSDKTVNIANNFPNVKIVYQKNTEAYTSSEFDIYLDNCRYKYSILVTASDIIHPVLAKRIKELVMTEFFDYDVIEVPYKPYFLGICEPYSPWFLSYTNKVFKTSCISVNKGEVHKALNLIARSKYRIETEFSDEAYYHLTHQNADSIMERNLRYWRGERNSNESLSNISNWVIKKTIRYFILNCVFFKGKTAIALAFSYLSYYMMSYVYRWEAKYSHAEKTYKQLKEKINSNWNEFDCK